MLLRVPILRLARHLHIGDAQKRIPPSEDAARPSRLLRPEASLNMFSRRMSELRFARNAAMFILRSRVLDVMKDCYYSCSESSRRQFVSE